MTTLSRFADNTQQPTGTRVMGGPGQSAFSTRVGITDTFENGIMVGGTSIRDIALDDDGFASVGSLRFILYDDSFDIGISTGIHADAGVYVNHDTARDALVIT